MQQTDAQLVQSLLKLELNSGLSDSGSNPFRPFGIVLLEVVLPITNLALPKELHHLLLEFLTCLGVHLRRDLPVDRNLEKKS